MSNSARRVSTPNRLRRQDPRPGAGHLADVFLTALRRAVKADPSRKITLPSGAVADAAEVARVLAAIDRARR